MSARTIRVTIIAALASLALLVPAGSAQAAASWTVVPFCGSYDTNGNIQPKVLKPGEVCSFWPVAVAAMNVHWDVRTSGSGGVCLGVVRSPPGWPNGTMLGMSGAPGPARCFPVGSGPNANLGWAAQNGFGAVYGQPVMINYSTATIRTRPHDADTYLTYYY
jgi:hypothetical protein